MRCVRREPRPSLFCVSTRNSLLCCMYKYVAEDDSCRTVTYTNSLLRVVGRQSQNGRLCFVAFLYMPSASEEPARFHLRSLCDHRTTQPRSNRVAKLTQFKLQRTHFKNAT